MPGYYDIDDIIMEEEVRTTLFSFVALGMMQNLHKFFVLMHAVLAAHFGCFSSRSTWCWPARSWFRNKQCKFSGNRKQVTLDVYVLMFFFDSI